MNELLEQFLLECRELIQAATQDLLALEAAPGDTGRVDSVFRGLHTLKGAAGIVEFPAMSQVMHAAEDILAAVRAGERRITSDLVSDCLTCLDQLAQWLDETEAQGAVPTVSDAVVAALLAKLSAWDAAPEPLVAAPSDWLAALLARAVEHQAQAQTAFRFTPAPDSFFRNQDPLAIVAGIPGLLALEISPQQPWPVLQELDPFTCNLVITGLTAASAADVASLLRPIAGGVDVHALNDLRGDRQREDLPADAVRLLEEQIRLAEVAPDEGYAGRLGAAGLVAANVLRATGRTEAAQSVTAALMRAQSDGDGAGFVAVLRAILSPPVEPPAAVPEPATEAPPAPQLSRALRVDIERIDALVNLAGELTVAKNAIGHTVRRIRDGADMSHALKDQHALLERLVADLQRTVLAIRVLPLRQTFRRFPRLVREMARELGKPVRLAIEGDATEADKATVEALFEPLLHVLRNALDHGVEPEAERRAAGKPPVATVLLRASRDGDQVVIEVGDDGAGIDTDAVRRVAAQRGVAPASVLAAMAEQAVTELIFSPGFSTAASVTGLSGRGVGMDAVRASIARLGGRVSVSSTRGIGTTIRFILPFSVLMLGVMTVEAGGQVFGIPLDAVVETTRVPRGRIARIGSAEAVVLRDRTVPLIRLADMLDLPPRPGAAEAADARVVVVSVAGQTGALEVESFGERMDLMVKPMEGLLAGTARFAGTTVLGDGRVLIILDLQELFG